MAFVRMFSSDVRKFRKSVEERWGVRVSRDVWFVVSSSGKVFAVSKGVERVDVSKLRVSSMGVYVADVSGKDVRLSFDGAMILGKDATRNVVELSHDRRDSWMSGDDISVESASDGWMIVKCEGDILGCGFVKENVLKNYVPKERRVRKRIGVSE